MTQMAEIIKQTELVKKITFRQEGAKVILTIHTKDVYAAMLLADAAEKSVGPHNNKVALTFNSQLLEREPDK